MRNKTQNFQVHVLQTQKVQNNGTQLQYMYMYNKLILFIHLLLLLLLLLLYLSSGDLDR